MSRKISILLFVLGIICLGTGCYLSFTSPKEKEEDTVPTVSEVDEQEKVDVDQNNIKDYSEYNNYKYKLTGSATMDEDELTCNSDGFIDVKNNIANDNMSCLGLAQYVYYDMNSGIHYYSEDKVKWEKNQIDETKLPDFTKIISKVKSNDGVTKLDNGDFTFDYNLIFDEEEYTVKVTVSFTSDGYLSKVTYDFGDSYYVYDSYMAIYEFSSVNQVEDTSIPNEIITGATQGSNSFDVNYIS